MPKERKQFLSQFFPRSAPLRATMIGTALEDLFLPWSHGAEQNSDVNVLGRYTSLYHRAERSGEKCPGNIGQRNCQSVIRSVCAYISFYLWRPITISNWWQTNHKVVQQQNPNSHWKWNHKHPNSIHQTEVTEVVLNNCLWSLDCWNFIAVVEPRNSLPRPHIEC